VCAEGWVGPLCQAQDAFFEEVYDEWACPWAVYPPGVLGGALAVYLKLAAAVGAVLTVIAAISIKKRNSRSRLLENIGSRPGPMSPRPSTPHGRREMTPTAYSKSTVYQ